VDADDDEALLVGPKRKKGAKKPSNAMKQIFAQQDDEEEGYMHRKSPALFVMGPKPSQEYFHTVAERATHTP
jgi:hypothetical protein